MVISSAETLARTATTPIAVTFTWSEDVTGFTAAMVFVTAGVTKSAMTEITATSWTFELTPAVEGNVVVHVPAAVLQDQVSRPRGVPLSPSLSPSLSLSLSLSPP